MFYLTTLEVNVLFNDASNTFNLRVYGNGSLQWSKMNLDLKKQQNKHDILVKFSIFILPFSFIFFFFHVFIIKKHTT